ncbi:MAG TPA: hypothetical protein VF666_11105 [Pyrinomonadaceae bacterium]|jgi:hypothetical protein
MSRLARLHTLMLSGICALTATNIAVAQTATPSPAPARSKSAAAKPRAEADPLAEARRNTAISLVNSLADEARNFRDAMLRARVQARAADALWDTNKVRARELFQRAWEAAVAADEETGRLIREAGQGANSGQAVAELRNRPSVRREVLRLAARRDRALGEEFLGKLDESKKQETASGGAASANQPTPRIDPDNPPPAMMQRLRLAVQLLEDGDVERAMQFADSALYPVNTYGANFLDMLREKNKEAADQRYMSLLARAAIDPVSDGNTVSLLSSYVFTPYIYINFQPDGNSHTRRWRDDNSPRADLSPALRQAFFDAAAAILLRPLPPPEQDTTTTGRAGTYMVIARLAPLFEQHAPDKAAALRARLGILQPDTPENLRQGDRTLTYGLVPEDRNADRLQDLTLQLDQAKTPDERDRIYFRAAMELSERDITRAREYADKIENVDLRKQVRAAVDFRAVENALRNKDAEEALRQSRSGELTHLQRTYGITSAARLLSKSDRGRAIEILEEALTVARRIDLGSPDRVRAIVAIITPMAELDRARVWEMMSEVVKASNAAAQFTGEDGYLMVRVQLTGGGAMTMNIPVENFDLTGIFQLLAKDDLTRAVELAKSFTAESPRAVATLAIARSILDKRKAVASTQ